MRLASRVLGTISLLAALAWWGLRRDEDAPAQEAAARSGSQHEPHTEDAELSALRARVVRLEQQLSALQLASSAARADCARASSPGSSAQLPSVVVAEPLPAPDLVATFDRDPRPAEQTPRVAQLESRMKALLPRDASLDRLDCRGEICRAELTLPGITRYHEFIKSAFGDPNTRVWSGATKFGYLTEPDPQNWEHDEISVYAYLGPEATGAEP